MAAWRVLSKVRLRPRSDFTSPVAQRRNISLVKYLRTVTVAKPLVLSDKSLFTVQFTKWLRQYEDFVGLSEVKEAQDRVIEAQKKFMETQEARRDRQQQIQQVQHQLKNIHTELDKTSRGEDRYLHLITQEHAIIKREKQLIDEFQSFEKAEREYFSLLSNAVRTSHEKERAQAEKTKYWSIIGSICGAIIGIVGTTINNWLRMRELRGLVTESTLPSNFQSLIADLTETAKNQHNLLTLFIADLKTLLTNENTDALKANLFPGITAPHEKIEIQTNEILAAVKRQESQLTNEMKDIKAMIVARNATDDVAQGTAIYIGRDVERIIKDTQDNLEYKIKLNALATVAMIYGVLALTVPLLFKAFGGG